MTKQRTKNQLHRQMVSDALAQGAAMLAVCLLIGFYISVVLEWVLIPVGIVLVIWWNNRVGKRRWHAYYFNTDGSPKRHEELL